MKFKKYPLSVSDAEIAVLALKEAIRLLGDVDPDGLIPFKGFYISRANDLLERLTMFDWEAK